MNVNSPGKSSHLQVPDGLALLRESLHRVAHESDEHVEHQDVSEDDVADEQDVEDRLVLDVVGERQISHSDRELEHLHYGEADVVVTRLLARHSFDIEDPYLWDCAVALVQVNVR